MEPGELPVLELPVMNTPPRDFTVLLIAGASGTGKSSLAYQLGRHYGINVVQVDDFQCLVEAVTTEADYPVFHYWKNHFDEARRLPLARQLDIMVSYARQLSVFLEAVVENHREEARPMILEGDFLSPEFCQKMTQDDPFGTCRCLLVTEDSRDQIAENYRRREGHTQEDRAALSALYNQWLVTNAGPGMNLVASRPWDTVLERSLDALRA